MKKISVIAALCGILMVAGSTIYAQEKCGNNILLRQMIAKDNTLAARVDQYALESKQRTDDYVKQMQNSARKTTAGGVTVAVVFHVLLNQTQINSIGGTQGIYDRVRSQIESLNHDYNAANSDSSLIPAAFKPLYGNPQIHFSVAHLKPDGTGTTGVEVKVVSAAGYDNQDPSPKQASAGGLDPWDNTKYINIWIVNITAGSSSQVLGYSYSPGYAANVIGNGQLAGLVIHYGALGVQTSSNFTQFWISGSIKGRTVTHEMGHYFDLWHIWGKTGDPNTDNCSDDDYIADTPNQSKSCQTCQNFPFYDMCTTSGNGVMFMNYMDYIPDDCMHMFSKGQATHMAAQLAAGGPSATLTYHPEIFFWPAGISSIDKNNSFEVYPNPATRNISINFANDPVNLESIAVLDATGRSMKQITGVQQNNYSLDLSGLPKGIYIVQCRFEEGVVNKKIILQ